MSEHDFIIWLQGFLEGSSGGLDEDQTQSIQNKMLTITPPSIHIPFTQDEISHRNIFDVQCMGTASDMAADLARRVRYGK